MMKLFAFATIAAALLLPPASASAQRVHVRLTGSESGTPLSGVFVSLLDGEGRALWSGLSDESGRLVVSAPSAGTFRVKAELIGRETVTSGPVRVPAGGSVDLSLSLSFHAIALGEIRVEADQRCSLRPGEATELARVWDEARKPLTVQEWAERQGLYRLRIATWERDLDRTGRTVEREERRGVSRVTRVPFATLPAQELVADGFIRPLEDGGHQYFGADAALLLSDAFLDTHCLRLARSAERPGQIGLAFEPQRAGTPDIRGTLWLDEATAALRLVEYAYTEAPYPEAEGVAGGRVELESLPDGGWMIARWWIRAPLLARHVYLARGDDSGIRVQGIRESGGEVLGVSSLDGRSLSVVQRGSLRGTVWDSTRSAPLAGATVLLAGTGFRTEADPQGSFLLSGLPEGIFTARFTHPRLDSLGVELAGEEVEVVPGATTEVALAIPSMGALEAAFPLDEREALDRVDALLSASRGRVGEPGAQGVQGVLLERDSGARIRSAEVTLRMGSGHVVGTAVSDAHGFFRVQTPDSGSYRLEARALGYGGVEDERVEVALGELSVLEVRMAPEAFELAPIVVTAERRVFHLEMQGFYTRRNEGGGRFISPEDLEERRPGVLSQVLRGVPGVFVAEDNTGLRGSAVYFRSGLRASSFSGNTLNPGSVCWPMVFLDRQPVSLGGLVSAGAEPAMLDELVHPSDVWAVEVYRSAAEIPSEFNGQNSGCGVIVIWTKGASGG